MQEGGANPKTPRRASWPPRRGIERVKTETAPVPGCVNIVARNALSSPVRFTRKIVRQSTKAVDMRGIYIGVFMAIASAFASADWPMLAHDPQRSGAISDEIRPPFERKW